MKKIRICSILAVLVLLCCGLFAAALAETAVDRVTIRYYYNVAAYTQPTGHSTFVGWAKMNQQYRVLSRVRGHGTKMLPWWYLVQLDDGQTAYIPEAYTSPVIDNAEEIAIGHVWINPQQNLLVFRRPDSRSAKMGWAWKQQVYPVIGQKEYGFWKIAMPDGTVGYVSSENAFVYDPVEDAKPRYVTISQRCVIREHPWFEESEVLTGIGPNEVLRCVYVYKKDWYEVETKHGGYGFIHSSVCQLHEGEMPRTVQN